MEWFNVDRAGLAAILARKGKAFAIYELLGNAWDAEATEVSVEIHPIASSPYCKLVVQDNSPKGWEDLNHAFTMFSRSNRADKAEKRGRFNLGEKLVLACCRSATIETMHGSFVFDETGRHSSSVRTGQGTKFSCEIRITRDELGEICRQVAKIIPPVKTTFDGVALQRPRHLHTFECRLPTEIADGDGTLRRTMRTTKVEAFEGEGQGMILEMGIPVCDADWPWRLNILQKVPLNMERDAVTEQFRKALQVAATTALYKSLEGGDPEQFSQPWLVEATEDARIGGEAFRSILAGRFGDRPVIAVPGDPMANAAAEATGCTVIHGGAMSSGAWANLRKFTQTPTTSAAFPTPKPTAVPKVGICPMCKRALDVVG